MSRDVEVLRRGFDAERADHAHALAERDRQRGIGARHGRSAARSRRGRDRFRICAIALAVVDRAGAARSHARSGRAAPRCRRANRRSGLPSLARREWRFPAAGSCGIDGDQRQIGLPGGDLLRQRLEAGSVDARTSRREPRRAATARRRARHRPSRRRSPETVWSRPAPPQRTAAPPAETTMIGPCWDIWQLGSTQSN